ncbi:MAG TPA: hypothetical protein VMW10_03395 [Alphaproteobacteria bacterium]|nr:hypothetical protein [Alphaproteobacteria bacterium]
MTTKLKIDNSFLIRPSFFIFYFFAEESGFLGAGGKALEDLQHLLGPQHLEDGRSQQVIPSEQTSKSP